MKMKRCSAPVVHVDEEVCEPPAKRLKNDIEKDAVKLYDQLDDEDYELLEENLGVKVERKRFKRLRQIQDEESEEEQDVKTERERIAMELFDTSDNEEEWASEKRHCPEGKHSDEENSDSDDFIVSDCELHIADRREKRKPIFKDVSTPKKTAHKKTAHKKTTRKSIFEIYEPSELKRGYFTDHDSEIRNTDIPERMQLRDCPVTAVPEGSDELNEESEWIYKQAFCKPTISNQDGHGGAHAQDRARKGPHTILKIKNALDLMRNQHFEVPFIAFYRTECIQPELNINDLWIVYKFDEKWCQLQTRKRNLIGLFEKMRDYLAEQLMREPDKPIPDSVRLLMDEDIDRLRAVQTPEELGDVRTHFMLYYSDEVPKMQKTWLAKERAAAQKNRRKHRVIAGREEGGDGEEDETEEVGDEPPKNETLKRAIRSGPYSIFKKAGLGGLAKKFGLTPEQFGENLRDNYQRHEVEQEPAEPMEVAMEYISNKFTTGEEVLRAAKFMVATQLSHDPLVRKCVRETFFERAKLNIKPTKKGIKEINESHPCYSMKYVKNKPVRDLTGDEYLKLTLAEADKLITVSISERIDGITSPSYIEEVKQLFYRDEFSKSVQEWNSLRAESVELALAHLLLPELRKELQIHLLAEAREAVLKTCRRKLYNWLKVAPYSVKFANEDKEEWDTRKGLRVMAVAYVVDYSQAAFACIVAPNGDCTHYLRLPHLLKRKRSYREEERLQKQADILAMRNFIATKKPHVICVGGESQEALMVAADLREIIHQLVEDEEFPSVSVEICDNELAKIYSASGKSENEFQDYPRLLRQAISLARRMQDPLIEFSKLCTSDEEILCLRYHTLQGQVPREELLEALYLEFVNRTNEVGVDIKLAVLRSDTCNLLQFVCGLGPRKGQALLKILKQNNYWLENRRQLVTSCHMGPKVFMNCAGFIKIGNSTETYEWARKMAVGALEHVDEDANPVEAFKEILGAPRGLQDKNHERRPPKDPFYDHDAELKEDGAKNKKQQNAVKRLINHPSFCNVGTGEAEHLLDDMDQGDVIVTPSSKGTDHLTLTWKVTDQIYQNIDILESLKENPWSLGQSLSIGHQVFEDLDEVISRCVHPMASHTRDLLRFRYYKATEGQTRKAENIIMEERRKNPSKIHYVLGASKSYPGKFLLSYLPHTRFHHEYITVTPEGFRFRQRIFGSVGSLFRWFKENFREPIPGAASTPRGAATNRTPYNGAPNVNLAGINPDAVKRVAQALPNYMFHSLSQVASQMPHYRHTHLPGGGGYGTNVHTHRNTLYTSSG